MFRNWRKRYSYLVSDDIARIARFLDINLTETRELSLESKKSKAIIAPYIGEAFEGDCITVTEPSVFLDHNSMFDAVKVCADFYMEKIADRDVSLSRN